MTTENTIIKLLPYQDKFIFDAAPYPAAVTAWGTGKTLAGIVKAVALSESNPGNLGIIFRKEYTDLRDSTVRDFEVYTGLGINSQRNVEFPNGSAIMFRHLEEMNNIQNVNLGWFWIEQAEELDTDDSYFKLFGRLRRKHMPHCGYITANAKGHNWIWRLWKRGDFSRRIKELAEAQPHLFAHLDPSQKDLAPLYEADTFSNKENLSPSFMAGLEIMRAEKPHLYNRFVLNSWEESDSVDIIIKAEDVNKSLGRDLNESSGPVRKVVSIDVARYGDDKIVFVAIENNTELERESHEKKSTMETVGLALKFAKKYDIESFAVDEIGVGGGVADRLAELEKDVVFVNAAERKNVRTDCFNRRAEIYLNGAELFEAGRVSLLESDRDLAEQLSWAKYKTIKSNGIFQVEAKEDIKERYGRSPDDADAFLNGLWALPQVKPVQTEDKYARRFLKNRKVLSRSGMTV